MIDKLIGCTNKKKIESLGVLRRESGGGEGKRIWLKPGETRNSVRAQNFDPQSLKQIKSYLKCMRKAYLCLCYIAYYNAV